MYRFSLAVISLLVLVAVALSAPAAFAQGGYRTTEFEKYGLELPVPRNYDAIPVSPSEEYLVVQWKAKPNPREKDKASNRSLPSLKIAWIDPPPIVAEDESKADDEDADTVDDDTGDDDADEERIDDLESLFEHDWNDYWRLGAKSQEDMVDGYEVFSASLVHGPKNRASSYRGWARSYSKDGRTIAFIGLCHEDDWKDSLKIWEHMANKLEFDEPKEVGDSKWDRYYAKKKRLSCTFSGWIPDECGQALRERRRSIGRAWRSALKRNESRMTYG